MIYLYTLDTMETIFTSEILQQQFSDIYQDFFASCETVVSVPLTIKRIPTWIGSRSSNTNIISKASLKLYVWQQKTNTKSDITIQKFNTLTQKFEISTMEKMYDISKESVLWCLDTCPIKWSLAILIESTEWHWFWITGSLSAWIASLAAHLNQTKDINIIIELATKIQQICKPWSDHIDRIVWSITTDYPLFYEYKWNYQWWLPHTKQWWLEYVCVFDGKQIPILKAHASLQRNKMNSDWYEDDSSMDIREWCIQSYYNYSKRLTKALHSYVVEWNDDIHILQIIINLYNQIGWLLGLCYWDNDFINQLSQYINVNGVGIVPIYHSAYGWWYLCIGWTNTGTAIKDALPKISTQYPHAAIELISHGSISTQWAIIEQEIGQDNYSDHIEEWTLIYRDNKWWYTQWHYDELITQNHAHILLDLINRKCYINGEKVNSNQLKSQSTTVELLSKLLIAKQNRISNTELEASSYSRQQNQMLGKIILPLKRLTKEVFNEEVIIECHGTLRDFELTLQPTTLTIWYIQKLWQ